MQLSMMYRNGCWFSLNTHTEGTFWVHVYLEKSNEWYPSVCTWREYRVNTVWKTWKCQGIWQLKIENVRRFTKCHGKISYGKLFIVNFHHSWDGKMSNNKWRWWIKIHHRHLLLLSLQVDSLPEFVGLVWRSAAAWCCPTFVRWTLAVTLSQWVTAP